MARDDSASDKRANASCGACFFDRFNWGRLFRPKASGVAWSGLVVAGRTLNVVLSFLLFTLFDVLEVLLCFDYKLADYVAEGKQNPCYCSYSPSDDAIATTTSCDGEIFVLSMISAA
ncbi:hypothetical protein Cni_G18836 [Canna indica]|uniref:Uncharacterized protein n=1 Tax=Canna indica TaxID=4628 RepID=A0AAQ3KQ43_9LILI|nr:hypothetical protein Cni_G18836 [Canna indica]